MRTPEMPAGQGQDAMRFAAAVETGNPGFPPDAALSRDLEVVGMLRSTGASMAPGSATSARMKDRLFASIAAEMIDAEAPEIAQPVVGQRVVGRPAAEPVQNRPRRDRHRRDRLASVIPIGSGRHRIPSTAPTGSLAKRFVLVSAAAAMLSIVLSSTGVLLSQSAVPGDALYAMKRSAESASLGLVFGDAEKARKHLEFASNRLDEVQQLVTESGAQGPDAALVAETLGDFDAAARTGSRLLLASASEGDPAQLGTLRDWAGSQSKRLSSMLPALPTSAQSDGDDTLALLNRMQNRTDALNLRQACREVTSGIIDDLGPLPSAGRCTPPADPTASRTRTPAGTPPAPNTSADPGGLLPGSPELPQLPPLLPGTEPNGTQSGPPPVRIPAPLPEIALPSLLPGLPGFTIG